jgi:hypothetical protein
MPGQGFVNAGIEQVGTRWNKLERDGTRMTRMLPMIPDKYQAIL